MTSCPATGGRSRRRRDVRGRLWPARHHLGRGRRDPAGGRPGGAGRRCRELRARPPRGRGRSRGINYVHNTIREHPQRDLVHDWLVVRGFRAPSTVTCASGRQHAGDAVATATAPAAASTTRAATRAGRRRAARRKAATSTWTTTATEPTVAVRGAGRDTSGAPARRRLVRYAARPPRSRRPARRRVQVVEDGGGAQPRPVVVEQLARQVGVEEREPSPLLNQLTCATNAPPVVARRRFSNRRGSRGSGPRRPRGPRPPRAAGPRRRCRPPAPPRRTNARRGRGRPRPGAPRRAWPPRG